MGAPLSLAEIVREPHLLILGESRVGKSSLLYKIKGEKPLLVTPTVGFIAEKVERENLAINVVEVGGTMVPDYAEQFYPNLSLLVYVVDASNPKKLADGAVDLWARLENGKLQNVPILVLANKNDAPNIASAQEIEEKVRFGELSENRKCAVRSVSAETGDGIEDAVKWIIENMTKIETPKQSEAAQEPEPLEMSQDA